MKVSAEIVNGKCPTCDEYTMLVSLSPELYRCMNCGSDLQQHVNGKISYLPHIAKPKDCLLYTSPSPRDGLLSRMPSSA